MAVWPIVPSERRRESIVPIGSTYSLMLRGMLYRQAKNAPKWVNMADNNISMIETPKPQLSRGLALDSAPWRLSVAPMMDWTNKAR